MNSFRFVHYENIQRRSPTVRDPRFGSWSNRDLLVRRLFGRSASPLGARKENRGITKNEATVGTIKI